MSNLPVGNEAARSDGRTLSDVAITPKAGEEKPIMLNWNKLQGPNGTPSRFPMEQSRELALPISILFSQSMEPGVFPLQ